MQHATYIGPRQDLRGMRALIRVKPKSNCLCLAQFDRISTGLGYGWHEFTWDAFKLDDPVDWS